MNTNRYKKNKSNIYIVCYEQLKSIINRWVILYIIIILISCSNNKQIKVTSEYIVNQNWNKQANSILIRKIYLKKDSTVNLSNLNQTEVMGKFEEDSSFRYTANVKLNSSEEYKEKKIYFNRDNGFYWYTNNGDDSKKIIGNLKKGHWYKFSRLLTHPFDIYVYIDSLNEVHRWDVIYSNY